MTEETGAAGSNVRDELIVFHHSRLAEIEREEHEANETLKAIRKRKKDYRNTIKGDGVKLKNFDRAREILTGDEDELKADMVETGRLLRAFNHPVGHQFDMFEEPDREAQEDRWKFDGFRAGASGKGREENPHRYGDNGHKAWDQGWNDAQAVIAAGMQISQSAGEDDSDDGSGEDGAESAGETAGQSEIDTAPEPEPAPQSEEEALEGATS